MDRLTRSGAQGRRFGIVVLVPALLLGCSEVASERAEPTAEPPILAVSAGPSAGDDDDRGNIRVAGGVDFDGGVRVDDVVVSPARPRPGEPVHVTMTISGSTPGLRGRVGLRTPRSAGREELRPTGAQTDPRDVFAELDLRDGAVEVDLELPSPWHPSTAILELTLSDGDRPLAARRGARSDDGRGFLGVVRIARQPTAVSAPKMSPKVDGALGEQTWERPPALLVESLDGEPGPQPPTEVWFAWDADNLYVAGDLPDDDLWTTYGAQDDPLYKQEAFELFIAGDRTGKRYLEYQVSARGITFDARFPAYRRGDESWDSRWLTAVDVDGTINDARDRDRGWTVEVAIPWSELCAETTVLCPPAPGTTLNVNVFRLDHPGRKETVATALSPTLRPDFHAWENAAHLELR